MSTAPQLQLFALPDFPMVEPGDDLAALILASLDTAGLELATGDILVLAQKIVSKAEGRYVELATVVPGEEAHAWAQRVEKEPALVQLILDESTEVVRHRPGAMIVAHKLGIVHANAGIDRSNIDCRDGAERALLLPINPNASAQALRQQLETRCAGLASESTFVGVIISDSAGRAWRNGITGFAIGSSAVPPLRNQIGDTDLFGKTLEVTETADVDELASAASLLMGQGAEGTPVVLIRGWRWSPSTEDASSLVRPAEQDLFR